MTTERERQKFFIKHFHLHPNNSKLKQRHRSKYMTVAMIMEDGKEEPICVAESRCHAKDNIDRVAGNFVARERVIRTALRENKMTILEASPLIEQERARLTSRERLLLKHAELHAFTDDQLKKMHATEREKAILSALRIL